jgi:hypothetical protein
MEDEDYLGGHLLNLDTNIREMDVANRLIAEFGRDAWEELNEIAEGGSLYTSNGKVLAKVVVALDACGVRYKVKTGRPGFRFILEMEDRTQAIIFQHEGRDDPQPATDGDLTEEKWVRILADYSAEAVWCKDGAGTSLQCLPVSKALRDALYAWNLWYDYDCLDYLDKDDRGVEFPYAPFSAAGLELAKRVKAMLPDWTVVYFDEEKCRAKADDAPREEYEYEV